MGLTGLSESQMEVEQIEALERALKEQTSNVAVYLWNNAARKWAHRPSVPEKDVSGNILRSVHNTTPVTQNVGKGTIERNNLEVDNDITPAGQWVVFFTGTDLYQLYFRSTDEAGDTLKKLSNKTGRAGSLFYDDSIDGGSTEIRFSVTKGDTSFQFGDALRFTTTVSSQADSRSVAAGSVEKNNSGDGIIGEISIDEAADAPIDEWVILFIDPQHFNLKGRKTGVLTTNSEPHAGTVGEEFHHQDTGFRFSIMPGAKVFKAGDRFRFRTAEVGVIQATSESSGIMALMLNRDDRPPRRTR